MTNNESNSGWLDTLSLYAAWAITAAGSVINMLGVREAILSFLALFQVINAEAYRRKGGVGEDIFTNFGIAAFDNVMLLVLGCATIVAVIWIEYYLRKGRAKGLLYKRIGKIVVVEVAIIIGVILIRQIVAMILQARA